MSKPEKTEDIYGKTLSELEYQCEPVCIEVLDVLPKTDILLRAISDHSVVQSKYEDAVYFYHGDHLGSTNWITDWHGEPVQYIHYAPFGELIEDQCNGYDAQFKFTGKERDAETGYDYFGARFFWSAFSHWLSVDPLADKYPGISPYAYCGWNPIKYIDPNGKWFETAWDIANVALDISSLQSNISQGNIAGALLDGAGLLLDAAAAVLPAIPAGAGTALKAYRAADKVKDIEKANKFRENVQRGVQNERKILNEMKLEKNTKKVSSVTNTGELINVIPDAIKDNVMYEIKDTKAVYSTKQIQGEANAAKGMGADFKIVTGENTHVSDNIPTNIEIIRRNDIGPQ